MTAPHLKANFGLALLLCWMAAHGQDLALLDDVPDEQADELADIAEEEAASGWWHDDWSWRYRLTLEGGGLMAHPQGYFFLKSPDPLLLVNKGKCARDLRDVRIVDVNGQVLPSGLSGPLNDDGSTFIWCQGPKNSSDVRRVVFLYFGNPKAPRSKHELPVSVKPNPSLLVNAWSDGLLESPDGATEQTDEPFFRQTIFVEAEDLLPPGLAKDPKLKVKKTGASGEYVLAMPNTDAPEALQHTVEVPEAGTYHVHLRRFGGPSETTLNLNAEAFQFAPETRAVGWQSQTAELAAGELNIGLTTDGAADIDCVLLTRNADYQPDYRDFNGPVYMRFRVKNECDPFYVDFFCMNQTYTAEGMKGEHVGYLFKNDIALKRGAAEQLSRDDNQLLGSDQWTPWGKAMPIGSFTWFSEIRFIDAGSALDVEFQFATRPDRTRVFRSGRSNTGNLSKLYVHMPSTVRWNHVRDMTSSFEQWAEKRFSMATDMGFKQGEGPKKIVAGTMGHLYSWSEADYVYKTCAWLGLNMAAFHIYGYTQGDQEPLHANNGVPWYWAHNWTYSLKVPVPELAPSAGVDALANLEAHFEDVGNAYYPAYAKKYEGGSKAIFDRIQFNVMGDEIGAYVDFETINSNEAIRQAFVAYMAKHGMTPSDFGIDSWDPMHAIGHPPVLNAQAKRKKTAEAAKKAGEAEFGKVTPDNIDDALAHGLQKEMQSIATEEASELAEEKADPVVATAERRRRAWYWTQRFRSWYTARILHHYSRGMWESYPAGMQGSANLQAMPVQVGRMWDGELNIFELGREQAFNTLLIEDWCNGPHNVAFGMNLMRAAARKHQQKLAALVVGNRPGPRIFANLMEGCHSFLFYLYGPVYNIGNVWAEDAETYRQMGTRLRQIALCEEDILAAQPRPRGAAILVANTSEINQENFAYPIGRQRMTIYGAMKDAQVPVDIVGEEEVLEDGALSRYKILLVSDPHVRADAQRKIKEWVAKGGTLWADYAGLAFDEFHSRTTWMDDIFGLRDRGEVKPFPKGGRGWGCYGTPKLDAADHHLTIAQGEVFKRTKISGLTTSEGVRTLFYKPRYKVAGGEVLGQFSDGTPAVITNKYGKGRTYLLGLTAGLAYNGCFGNWSNASYFNQKPSSPERGGIITRPALVAGVKRHLETNHHYLQTAVHDGPQQAVVYLNNLGEPMDESIVRVTLPRKPLGAYAGNGQALPYTFADNQASFKVSLAKNAGEIVVFRFE